MNAPSTAKLPLSKLQLLLLCTVFLLVGLLGHDPWKTEDATHLGVAWSFATAGDWFNPRIAGEAWLGQPPFYHWLAAIFGKTFAELFGFHNAARLATLFCGSLLLFGLARAAGDMRRLREGKEASNFDPAALLLAIGTLGLLVPLHEAQPAIALLAASAISYWGMARMAEKPWAGILTGAGIGLAYLSGGMVALLTLVPVLLLTLVHRHWHTRACLIGCIPGIALTSVLVFLWPAGWQTDLPVLHVPGREQLELLAWFAWPCLPIAAWAVWLYRRKLRQPGIYLPLIGTLVTLIEFLLFFDPRPLPSLPLLIPQILLATAAADRLRRGANNAFNWFATMTFTIVAALIWLGAVAMMFGVPAKISYNFAKLEPGFVAQWNTLAWSIAALATIGWGLLLFCIPRSPWRSLTHWAGGVTLMWVLVATLWMPWVDYGKSYRGLAASLEKALPSQPGCIAGQGLGDAQRASLDYFSGIAPRMNSDASTSCRWLLVQGSARTPDTLPKQWQKVWEGNRPGDKNERFRLYKKKPSP